MHWKVMQRGIADSPQNWATLIVYSGYRTLLAMLLLLMFLVRAKDPMVGEKLPSLFLGTASTYAAFALVLLIYQIASSRAMSRLQIFVSLVIDIGAITLMFHSSGTQSGLELLVIVTVAAANMLLGGQIGMLIAALGSLAALGETTYGVYTGATKTDQFLPSGLLGVAFFTTAIVIQYLSRRILSAQQLAEARRGDVQQLMLISQRIVQNMRTGVIVMRPDGAIRLMNQAAAELLNIEYREGGLPQLAPRQLMELCRIYDQGSVRVQLDASGQEILVSFAALGADAHEDRLLFLEDMSKLSQQAQQLKLASLGRFTASIAHEIRNPLGAISHAAQLLSESEQLPQADKRLTEIIQNHSTRMNKVVENVLQFARRKNAEPRRFNLREWVQQFARDFHYNGGVIDVQVLKESSGYEVNVDPSHLEQIVTNLVSNGLRYSKKATGEERVILSLSQPATFHAPYLDVIDLGAGVRDEDREKIFEPFFTSESQGTGLGLYLSRELCEANQIHLFFLRDKDGRSCFRLQFSHPDRSSLSQNVLEAP